MLDTLEGMQEELRALRGAERGTLALAASTTPGSYVLPSILQCFADQHPQVDVDVVIGASRGWPGRWPYARCSSGSRARWTSPTA